MTPNWKEIAKIYDNKEWAFSSAFAWKKAVKENPTTYNLVQYADQLRLSGNSPEAKYIIEKAALEDVPEEYRSTYHTLKGQIYYDSGNIDVAIECYEKAVALEPDDTWHYIFLGVAFSKKHRLDEAETALRKALTKEGDIDEANYNLSLILARKGNFKEAVEAMERCLSIDPDYPAAATWLEDLKNMERQHHE